MGGRVAQRTHRPQARNGQFANFRLHVLRLVQDHDGLRRLNELDGLQARLAHLVDDVALALLFGRGTVPCAGCLGRILRKGVNVDNQNLDRIRQGKVAQLVDLGRLVHHELDTLVVIQRLEVLFGNLQAFHHPFTDCH